MERGEQSLKNIFNNLNLS